MAKLKDRRAAHRLVAEVLWSYMRKQQLSSTGMLDAPGVRAEVEKIREAHFAVGIITDDAPDDLEVSDAGALAMGGENRCQGCGKELNDKTKRLCDECQAKVEPEDPKNGKALPA